MGRYLTPGHTYVDGQIVTGPSLTEHVSEALFKTTLVTEQTLKDPAALTDQILVVASGSFFQVTLQQIHNLILYPGSIVQTITAEYTADTALTAGIPADDTIPQNTEGTEIINVSITPRFINSLILASFTSAFAGSGSQNCVAALFRDSVVGALAGQVISSGGANFVQVFSFVHQDAPATISPVSYKIRVGPDSGTMVINGDLPIRHLGGVSGAFLILQEIKQ